MTSNSLRQSRRRLRTQSLPGTSSSSSSSHGSRNGPPVPAATSAEAELTRDLSEDLQFLAWRHTPSCRWAWQRLSCLNAAFVA